MWQTFVHVNESHAVFRVCVCVFMCLFRFWIYRANSLKSNANAIKTTTFWIMKKCWRTCMCCANAYFIAPRWSSYSLIKYNFMKSEPVASINVVIVLFYSLQPCVSRCDRVNDFDSQLSFDQRRFFPLGKAMICKIHILYLLAINPSFFTNRLKN